MDQGWRITLRTALQQSSCMAPVQIFTLPVQCSSLNMALDRHLWRSPQTRRNPKQDLPFSASFCLDSGLD